AVADVAARVCERLTDGGWLAPDLRAGAGFPAVIKDGRSLTAANVDPGFIDCPVEQLLTEKLGRPVVVINDADAAGLAETAFGAGRGHRGVVLLLTIGTGIGSALLIDGRLMPNSELGHLQMHGRDAERLVSGTARERRHLGWKRWAREFNVYLAMVERYFTPDLIILGGGVSKEMPRYVKYLQSRAPLVPAAMLNTSGIVGAAMAADGGLAGAEAEAERADAQPVAPAGAS
ncbi:MAG TPA: ROK family protein, partial [Candidatus Sulfotelmatobacter sp.]|nr:ROK family protein [Candidatus Sulfotelmatobacter sp.]